MYHGKILWIYRKSSYTSNQVAGINEVFSIPQSELDHYQASIDAYAKANTGFVMLEGEVIAPLSLPKQKKCLIFTRKCLAKKLNKI